MILTIDSNVGNVDLREFKQYVAWHPNLGQYFPMEPGETYYKLLAYLSGQLPPKSKVVDLGTSIGSSAIALASNMAVEVITFDIVDMASGVNGKSFKSMPNIKFICANGLAFIDSYLDAKLIFLDINPHDGGQERNLIGELIKKDYKGIVICDDTNLSDAMKSFWSWVPLKKYDVTSYGHWSGTGLIVFDDRVLDVRIS